jgi:hypothetical protein
MNIIRLLEKLLNLLENAAIEIQSKRASLKICNAMVPVRPSGPRIGAVLIDLRDISSKVRLDHLCFR